MNSRKKFYLIVKGIFDPVIAFLGLVVLFIPLLIIALLIKIDSKGPVFFRQERVGKDNKLFSIFKFRTMYVEAPQNSPTDQLEDADSWITPIGKFLRKSSLDEVPQLLNIIKGEMSIVGPRPSLWNQYNLNQLRTERGVQTLKPGLTGLAQIHGRDENNDEEKCFFDYKYLNEISLLGDISIFCKTFISIAKSDGVIEGKSINVK